MIVACLAYYLFFKKSVEYRFFPPLSVSQIATALCFWWLQNSLSFPSDTWGKWVPPWRWLNQTCKSKQYSARAPRAWQRRALKTRCPRAPWHSKYPTKIKDRYIYWKIWRVDFPPSKNNGPILILCVCRAVLCLKDCKVSKFGNEDGRFRDNEPLLRLEYNTRS